MQTGATRTRPSWSSLPEGLRTSITAAIGGAHLDDLPGAAWFDLPCLLPSVEAGGGPQCEDAWSVFQEFGAPSPREHLPLIAGIASYFWFAQAQPEPAALPGLREFQRAQAVTALRWLSTLL